MAEMRSCFMPMSTKLCDSKCMAHNEGEGGEPICTILSLAEGFILSLFPGKPLRASYPPSPPPPEVKV